MSQGTDLRNKVKDARKNEVGSKTEVRGDVVSGDVQLEQSKKNEPKKK